MPAPSSISPSPFYLSAFLFVFVLKFPCVAQKTAPAASGGPSLQSGLAQAKSGHCKEAFSALKSKPRTEEQSLRRDVGLAGLRCATLTNQPDLLAEFLKILNQEFPSDPDVLYVSVHGYSDLSDRAAKHLAQVAPRSYQAHELNAEALELQGKWDQAAAEYQAVLKQNPESPGIHFRLGRILLSKPNPPPELAEQAKKEFEAELKIDPSNAGAEYVLGELARQDQQWDDAVKHFSRAAHLDSGFGDAFLGLGQSLIATKKFADAISPLETAVRLEPANPATHYNLATAYSRSGRKAEADKEFAIHRQMTQKEPTAQDSPQENPN
jgi:tetratricopeptide (TPR) repeat protein